MGIIFPIRNVVRFRDIKTSQLQEVIFPFNQPYNVTVLPVIIGATFFFQ
jgi:hypothetical protein